MNRISLLLLSILLLAKSTLAQFTNSNLPIVVINTNGQTIIDDTKIHVDLKILYKPDGSINYLTDTTAHYDGYAGIELRGSSSLTFPKKSYSIELQDINGHEIDFSVLGFPPESDWALIANYDDRSHLRNSYIYNLWGKTGNYSPRSKHVEVVINGEYIGLYLLIEKIKRDANRVNIKKLESTDTTATKITGGYIIEATREASALTQPYAWLSPHNSSPSSSYLMYFDCVYPKEPTTLQHNYIKNYLKAFEDTLKSPNFSNSLTGFRSFIDENSFVENFVIQEFSLSFDVFARSQYFYKDRGTKMKASPLWDFVPGLNDNYTDAWRFSCTFCDPRFFWVERMMQDCQFRGNVIEKYRNFRRTFLTTVASHAFIDSVANAIQYAALRDRNKWFSGSPTPFNTYTTQLKTFVNKRILWMDQNIQNIMGTGGSLFASTSSSAINSIVRLNSSCSNSYPVTWFYAYDDGTSGNFTGNNFVDVVMSKNVTYYAKCNIGSCPVYTNEQRIVVTNLCPSSLTFSSHTTLPNTQVFSTTHSINSTANLPSNSKIIYTANNSILLQPGFQANSNSGFQAIIKGCQ